MAKKISARFIIQIAGKPKENVDKALDFVLKKLKDETKFKLIEEDLVSSELDEESKLYSGFIEVLIKFNETIDLLNFIVDYTPNSIEVEEPEKISFSNVELTEILNHTSSKLLESQNIIRNLSAQIHLMNKNKETQN